MKLKKGHYYYYSTKIIFQLLEETETALVVKIVASSPVNNGIGGYFANSIGSVISLNKKSWINKLKEVKKENLILEIISI